MKFGLLFGHVASNHGDIAINRGSVRLLERASPGCRVVAPFLEPNAAYLDAARASVATDDAHASTVHTWRVPESGEGDDLDAVADALRDPQGFLQALGLGDCDAVFYNSGEHLFSPLDDNNAVDLLWRVAAGLAVKKAGLPLLMLPSTFGPLEGPIGSSLLNGFCELADGLAGREPKSLAALREKAPARAAGEWLLDPAFFMDAEAREIARTVPAAREGLGLVLRLEDYGMRIGKSRSAKALQAHKRTAFHDSLSHRFAMQAAAAYRDAGGTRLNVLVQTLADRELAKAIAAAAANRFDSLQVCLVQPASLREYMGHIAGLERLVSARFHACIFAMLTETSTFGVHSSVHGHKMPSLFAALGLGSQCLPMDALGTAAASLRGDEAAAARLPALLEDKRRQTVAWVAGALRSPARSPDLRSVERDALAALYAVARRDGKNAVRVQQEMFAKLREEKEQQSKAAAAQLAATVREHEQARGDWRLDRDRLRQEAEQQRKAAEQQRKAAEQQRKAAEQQRKAAERQRNELSQLVRSRRYRLGSAIADGLTGWRGLLKMPIKVVAAFAGGAAQPQIAAQPQGEPEPCSRLAGKRALNSEDKRWIDEQLRGALADGADAQALIGGWGDLDSQIRSFCLARASVAAKDQGLLEDAYRYARASWETFDNQMSAVALASAAFNSCRYEEAERLAADIDGRFPALPASVRRLLDDARGYAQLAKQATDAAAQHQAPREPGRSAYFLHSSLPHMSGGYALRSHGLIGGIRSTGFDIRPYTRPGFPADIGGASAEPKKPVETVDGIDYRRTFSSVARSDGEQKYMHACVETFGRALDETKPEVVHARSTYLIAVPALIAARRRGLPFVYEVSGLWELVHESRENAAVNKARTERMRFFENLVMRSADRVITLTEAMREELIARGVDSGKITLAPNSVDPSKYLPRKRDDALAAELGFPAGVPVIGYIGSFVDYEGLDDLIAAAGKLHRSGVDFRLLLVGDGAEFPRIKQLAEASDFREKIALTGRVPFDRVPAFYSLVDICPFPRKPWEVCEIVSPMKPFEPMAMEKAVVVSDTRALCDIVIDAETGLRFEKGNVDSLARVLAKLIADPELRARLGRQAREWVVAHRSWHAMGERVVGEYRAAVADAAREG